MHPTTRGLQAAVVAGLALAACTPERAPLAPDGASPFASAVPAPAGTVDATPWSADVEPGLTCGMLGDPALAMRSGFAADGGAPPMMSSVAVILNAPLTSTTGVPMYEVGALDGVGAARATDINDVGQIVGNGAAPGGGTHAFLWTEPGPFTDLGTMEPGGNSFAHGINNAGVVAGYATTTSGERAYRWTQGGGMQSLGVPAGYAKSWAMAINNAGQIAGYASLPGGRTHAALWTAGAWQILGSLQGATGVAYAYGINNLGHVVGVSTTASGRHAFLWRPGVGMIDLGILPGAQYSEAHAVNDNDEVVGYSVMSDGRYRGWYWSPTTPMTDLGDLGGSTGLTRAYAINNAGQVFGVSHTAIVGQLGGYHAFRWTRSTGMTDLGKHPNACSSYGYGTNESGFSVGANEFTALGFGYRAARWDVTVNRPPVPSVTGAVAGTCTAGSSITFTIADADGAGDGPWTYVINWGDGTPGTTGSATSLGAITVPHAYALNGSYTVTITVTDRHGAAGTATGTVSRACFAAACTRTQGYWKNHEEAYPFPYSATMKFLVNGPRSVTWDELFETPPKGGNSYIQLAHQWMAAKLNQSRGVAVPASVLTALNAAEAWLRANINADGSIPSIKSALANGWAGTLDAYNNGEAPGGPAHCN